MVVYQPGGDNDHAEFVYDEFSVQTFCVRVSPLPRIDPENLGHLQDIVSAARQSVLVPASRHSLSGGPAAVFGCSDTVVLVDRDDVDGCFLR